MEEKVVGIVQACAILGISSGALYKWKSKGLIQMVPPQQAGVKASEIERLLAARGEAGKNEA